MAIEDWMPALAEQLAETEGIEAVFYPGTDEGAALPASLPVFPCLVIIPLRGSQELRAGGPNIAVHQVQITLYVSQQILTEAYAIAIPFIKRLRNKIAERIKIGLTFVHHVLPVSPPGNWYEGPGAIQYADKSHLGIVFSVTVKEEETVTVAA